MGGNTHTSMYDAAAAASVNATLDSIISPIGKRFYLVKKNVKLWRSFKALKNYNVPVYILI